MKRIARRKAMWVQGACVLAVLILWSGSGMAQRRVFTNDDIPSPQMASEPAAPAAQPATTEPGQVAPPAAAVQEAGSPPDEITRLNGFMFTLGEIATDLTARIQATSDQRVTQRLAAYRDSIDAMVTEYREILSTLQAQQPQEPQEQTAAQPEAQQQTGTTP